MTALRITGIRSADNDTERCQYKAELVGITSRERWFHRISFFVFSIVVFAGCRSDEANTKDSALVIVIPREVREIDPRLCADAYSLKASRLVFASLVTINPSTLEPIPDLAERVEVVSPNTALH